MRNRSALCSIGLASNQVPECACCSLRLRSTRAFKSKRTRLLVERYDELSEEVSPPEERDFCWGENRSELQLPPRDVCREAAFPFVMHAWAAGSCSRRLLALT